MPAFNAVRLGRVVQDAMFPRVCFIIVCSLSLLLLVEKEDEEEEDDDDEEE